MSPSTIKYFPEFKDDKETKSTNYVEEIQPVQSVQPVQPDVVSEETKSEKPKKETVPGFKAFENEEQEAKPSDALSGLLSRQPDTVRAIGNLQTFIQYQNTFRTAHEEATRNIIAMIDAFYGTPQDVALDEKYDKQMRGDLGKYKEGLESEFDRPLEQVAIPERRQQTLAVASQMALGMLGDLMASSTSSRAPMQSVSSSVIDVAATGLEARRVEDETKMAEANLLNLKLLEADKSRRLDILKNLSAIEQGALTQAMNEYSVESQNVRATLGLMANTYSTESQNKNSLYDRILRADMANAQSKMGQINAALGAVQAIQKDKELSAAERKYRMSLYFPKKVTQKLYANATEIGINGNSINALFGRLSEKIGNIREYSNAAQNYAEAIKKQWNRISKEQGRFFDSSKNYDYSVYMNTILSFAERGLVVDPTRATAIIGQLADINVDTGGSIYGDFTDKVAKAVRALELGTGYESVNINGKEVSLEALIMLQNKARLQGETFLSPELEEKVYNSYEIANQVNQMDKHQKDVAALGVLRAFADIPLNFEKGASKPWVNNLGEEQ